MSFWDPDANPVVRALYNWFRKTDSISIADKIESLDDAGLSKLAEALRSRPGLLRALELEPDDAELIEFGGLDDVPEGDEYEASSSRALVVSQSRETATLSEGEFAEMSGYLHTPYLAYDHARALTKRNASGDRRLATALYRMAAEAGIFDAWVWLGNLHYEFEDTIDIPVALDYYFKALAFTRSGVSLQRLARELRSGTHVVADPVGAAQCFVRLLRASGISEAGIQEARSYLSSDENAGLLSEAMDRECKSIPAKFLPDRSTVFSGWLGLQQITDRVDLARNMFQPFGVRVSANDKANRIQIGGVVQMRRAGSGGT